MITWMYERCVRKHTEATTESRKHLYAERVDVLMQGCRSTSAAVRSAAIDMTRSMSDISDDENSSTFGSSVMEICNAMDDAERAVAVGTHLAEAGSNPASSAHVNAVADALLQMLGENGADEAMEEEQQSDSDSPMETLEERRNQDSSSEMCGVSDPEEWMLYHHGGLDDDGASSSS